MNVFLTSIMHPETSNDYESVLRNFETSLKSVCSQTDIDFRVVVVCNHVPDVKYTSKHVVYHVVDFYPAEKNGDIHVKRQDKAAKLLSGLIYIEKFNPKFVFIYDADDWLHNDINRFLNSKEENVCFYTNSGYMVDIKAQTYLKKFGLYRYCGSTNAIPYRHLMDALRVPPDLSVGAQKDEILRFLPEKLVSALFGGHSYVLYMRSKGFGCDPFPMNATAWIRNTGNNIRTDAQEVKGLPLNSRVIGIFFSAGDHLFCQRKARLIDLFIYSKALGFSWARSRFLGDHRDTDMFKNL